MRKRHVRVMARHDARWIPGKTPHGIRIEGALKGGRDVLSGSCEAE